LRWLTLHGKSNNNNGGFSEILKVGVGVISFFCTFTQGVAVSPEVQSSAGSPLLKIRKRACGFLSAAQVDQRRRNENREGRLIRV
jgi:hypothetical protein